MASCRSPNYRLSCTSNIRTPNPMCELSTGINCILHVAPCTVNQIEMQPAYYICGGTYHSQPPSLLDHPLTIRVTQGNPCLPFTPLQMHDCCPACPGFMAGSKWADGIGAFINLESTGPGGPDVLFQHTGEHPSQSVENAALNSTAQPSWRAQRTHILMILSQAACRPEMCAGPHAEHVG